jgi:hypothetical protein
MRSNLIATGLIDDPDPEGVDNYGMLPLYAEIEDDNDEPEEDQADREDRKEEKKKPMAADSLGAKGGESGDDEPEALIQPSSFTVETDEDMEFTDDENAYDALTEPGASDLSPAEATSLIDYMRPLSDDELLMLEEPLMRDLQWVDDPVHTADVLKAGKDGKGVDKYLNDTTYGESMATSTTLAPRTVSPQIALGHRFYRKLKAEHANFLADDDLAKNIAVRPRSFYENVSKLWAKSLLVKASIPWAAPEPVVQAAVKQVLVATVAVRLPYSKALASSGMEGWGWNPIKAVTSAVKKVVAPVYKYSGAKFITDKSKQAAGLAYKYSGAKYVVSKAQAAALYPIKMLIRTQTNKVVNARAAAIAKTRNLPAPTASERTEALAWAKNTMRTKNGPLGSLVASLMGADHGMQTMDVSMGAELSGDDMGGVLDLITAGPAAILRLFGSLFNGIAQGISPKKGGAAPVDPNAQDPNAQYPGDPNAQYPGDPNAQDPNAQDPYAQDPGAQGQYAQDPYAGDPGGGDPYGGDGSYGDSYVVRTLKGKYPQGITLEQLNQEPKQDRQIIKTLVREQRIRLR